MAKRTLYPYDRAFRQSRSCVLNTDFRTKASHWVGVAGVLLLTPFSVNHFRLGRVALGFGTLTIILVLAALAWWGRRGRYMPWLVFLGLTPAVLVFVGISFRDQGVIGALWCFPAVLVFYFTLPEKQAWISNAALYLMAVPFAGTYLMEGVAARVAATLLGVSAFSAIFVRLIDMQQQVLEERAVTDVLTGLYNRTLLASTLEQAAEQSRRAGTPMTLLTLDLDGFKAVNDTLGHAAGDVVLSGVADALRSRIRRSDTAFRFGGEEFLILLFDTDQEEGLRVAEELRSAVESRSLVPDRTVTVSIGVAAFAGEDDWEVWVKRSDENLYRAKAEGGNAVVG